MRHFLLFLVFFTLIAAIVVRVRYGGGEPYPDLTTDPEIDESALEEVFSYPEPIGNVAVSPGGRLFFTVHPESRPQGNRLLEWVEGAAVPYPSGTVQLHLFDTILGLVVDRQNRLWTVDSGNHGFGEPRLLAFDLGSGEVVHDIKLGPEVAPAGSFLQDLQVTRDGNAVFIADASIWRKDPGIVVYDIPTRAARRVLNSHESVSAQNYLVRNPIRDMQFGAGLVTFKTGVDGIALDANDEWLYYAAISHSGLYRAKVRDLLDPNLPARQLESEVERFSEKPLSDGIALDEQGSIYITDVEHSAVFVVGGDQALRTLVQSPRIRWADSLSFGPDGWLYLADSAIPEQVLKSKEHIKSKGPYFVFRFRPNPDII